MAEFPSDKRISTCLIIIFQFMLIENVIGSSKISQRAPYPYSSWLNYWEVNANFHLEQNQEYICPACGRSFYRNDFDGCHVQKANNPSDRKWYIIPLCSNCNQSNQKLEVGNVALIPTPSNL